MTPKLVSFLLALFALVIRAANAYSMEVQDNREQWSPLMAADNEQTFDRYWTPTEETIDQDIYFHHNDAIKLVVPPLRYHFNPDKVSERIQRDDTKQKNMKIARQSKKITDLPAVSFTKPKSEKTIPFLIKIANEDKVTTRDLFKTAKLGKSTATDNRVYYEVTETVPPTAQKAAYFYDIPLQDISKDNQRIFVNTSEINRTNSLQDNLSKYNIHVSDKLKNYEVSRRTRMYYLPARNIPKGKQNRQNNLQVDPLIAVLFSNYGMYLPQFYKIHNGYKNLYGHLAFNNMHNHKPFGSYKMYSDTDYDYDDAPY